MSKSDNTKQKIGETFVTLVEERGLSKVSISLLVDKMGINRKTFYYHFTDKPTLVVWIFRSALSKCLEESFEPDQLLYPDQSLSDRYAELPCYVRVRLGVRSLDESDFFRIVADLLYARRSYYIKVFNAPGDAFSRYLEGLYQPAFASDINYILGGRFMPPKLVQYLARYYASAIFGSMHRQLEDPIPGVDEDTLHPFFNLTHEGLKHAIEDHPMRRVSQRR